MPFPPPPKAFTWYFAAAVIPLLGMALAAWLARRISRPLLRPYAAAAFSAVQCDTAGKAAGVHCCAGEEPAQSSRPMAETLRSRENVPTGSGEQFRFLIEAMGEGLVMCGRDGRVVTTNRAAERILGRERQALIGVRFPPPEWTVISENGQVPAPEDYPVALTLRDGVSTDNRLMMLRHAEGRELWLQVNCRPVHDDQGELREVLVTFADVSGLKVAEESLRLSKLRFQELYQQFSALLEGITDRIVLITSDWQLVWSNHDPGVHAAAAGVAGNCCFAHFFNRRDPCPGCPAEQVFASAEPAFGEMTDAGGRSWELRAFPVFGTDGQVRQTVVIAEDVTEKRENQRQRSRSAQLAALGELAAGVAHEINNPICGVINYAQLIINRAGEGSRERELAQRIAKEGNRIATIVRELLTFAREESGEARIVSLREALAEALALCENQLNKEGVILQIDLPADIPRVPSRSHQIQQLYLNLISNARHALSEKYPGAHPDKVLLISGRPVELGSRSFVRLRFRDHGTGIPAELLEKVLNPFVTTKPAGVGTGLGLSISFEIVKKHGGTLSLASECGHWTEVTVDLPAHLPGEAVLPVLPGGMP